IAPDHEGMYFEVWHRSDSDVLILHQAYLHIYRTNMLDIDEEEILCLHCDPDLPDNERHAQYRQGPHLHVRKAVDPIPHAHLALTLHREHLEQTLASADSLTQTLMLAVEMLSREILVAL